MKRKIARSESFDEQSFARHLVDFGIETGDWSKFLSKDGSNISELQQLCKCILKTKWQKIPRAELAGTIAGTILQCWEQGLDGPELWKQIIDELKFSFDETQPVDRSFLADEGKIPKIPLEEGMVVKTHDLTALKLHATEMQKKQQGVWDNGPNPEWTLPPGAVAKVTLVHASGSFRLQSSRVQRPGNDESFLAAPSIAHRLAVQRTSIA